QRWIKRRRHELELIRAERAACEQLRQECTALRGGLWQRTKAIDEERRALAEQSLALEQYRQQYVLSSADAVAAEKRVERLRRRWMAQNTETARAIASEREAVKIEVTQLDERQKVLHKTMEDLTVREANLAQRQTALEEAQTLADAQQDRMRQEV